MEKEQYPLKKVCIICAKGSIEDVYATLVMANGAVMEGIETKVFFTFFGLDAITTKQMKKLHTATIGNPCNAYARRLTFPINLRNVAGSGSRRFSNDEKSDGSVGYA